MHCLLYALSTVCKKIFEYKKIYAYGIFEAIFLYIYIRRYKKIEYKKTVTPLIF
jgi:hypothetical protein